VKSVRVWQLDLLSFGAMLNDGHCIEHDQLITAFAAVSLDVSPEFQSQENIACFDFAAR
jgi:hypothetical protein